MADVQTFETSATLAPFSWINKMAYGNRCRKKYIHL